MKQENFSVPESLYELFRTGKHEEFLNGLRKEGLLRPWLELLMETLSLTEKHVAEVMDIPREKLQRFRGKRGVKNPPDIPNENFKKLLEYWDTSREKGRWRLSRCKRCKKLFLWRERYMEYDEGSTVGQKTEFCWRHSRRLYLQAHRIGRRVKYPKTVDQWAEKELAKNWDFILSMVKKEQQQELRFEKREKLSVLDETVKPPKEKEIKIQLARITITPERTRIATVTSLFKAIEKSPQLAEHEVLSVDTENIIPGGHGVTYFVYLLAGED